MILFLLLLCIIPLLLIGGLIATFIAFVVWLVALLLAVAKTVTVKRAGE